MDKISNQAETESCDNFSETEAVKLIDKGHSLKIITINGTLR